MVLDELGTKFKSVEKNFETILDPNKHTIVRIDGYKFHRYTKRYFSTPFDLRIPLTFFESAIKMVNFFSKSIVFFYTQSDEISFYIPPSKYFIENKGWQEAPNIYNFRMQKIVSLFSSIFTTEFNINIQKISNDKIVKDTQINIFKHFVFKKFKFIAPDNMANFDCRIFQLDNINDVNEYFKWRRIDAIRNSKNQFSYAFLSHKETLNMSSNKRTERVYEKFGIKYYDLPDIFKVGIASVTDSVFSNRFDFNRTYDLKVFKTYRDLIETI